MLCALTVFVCFDLLLSWLYFFLLSTEFVRQLAFFAAQLVQFFSQPSFNFLFLLVLLVEFGALSFQLLLLVRKIAQQLWMWWLNNGTFWNCLENGYLLRVWEHSSSLLDVGWLPQLAFSRKHRSIPCGSWPSRREFQSLFAICVRLKLLPSFCVESLVSLCGATVMCRLFKKRREALGERGKLPRSLCTKRKARKRDKRTRNDSMARGQKKKKVRKTLQFYRVFGVEPPFQILGMCCSQLLLTSPLPFAFVVDPEFIITAMEHKIYLRDELPKMLQERAYVCKCCTSHTTYAHAPRAAYSYAYTSIALQRY